VQANLEYDYMVGDGVVIRLMCHIKQVHDVTYTDTLIGKDEILEMRNTHGKDGTVATSPWLE
jgi:hypothetical protein